MAKPYQLEYMEILNDNSLPSIQRTLKPFDDCQNQIQLFPEQKNNYPQFFNQNLVSKNRIIKHVTGQYAILKTFYYQLFKLCFEIQDQNNDYLQIMKQIIFDKELFYESRSIISKSSNHSTSRVSKKSNASNKINTQKQSREDIRIRTNKKYLSEFIQKLISSGQNNFQPVLNKYKVIDQVMIEFMHILLQNCQEQMQSAEQILQFLCQIFQITLISFDNCFKFQQSDVFLYLQQINGELQIFIAFTQIQQSQISQSSNNSSKNKKSESNKSLNNQKQQKQKSSQLNNFKQKELDSYKKNDKLSNNSQIDYVITSDLKEHEKKRNHISEKIFKQTNQIRQRNWQNELQSIKEKINYDQSKKQISQLPAYTYTNSHFAVATNPFHKKQTKQATNLTQMQVKQNEYNQMSKKSLQEQHSSSRRMDQSNADTIMNMLGDTIKSNDNIQSSISSVANLKNLNGSQVFGYTGLNSFASESYHKYMQREQNTQQFPFRNKFNKNTTQETVPVISMKKQIKSDSNLKQLQYNPNRFTAFTLKKLNNSNQVLQEESKLGLISLQKQNSQVINQWIKQNLGASSDFKDTKDNNQQKFEEPPVNNKQSRGISYHSRSSKGSKKQLEPQININNVSSEDSDNYSDTNKRNNYYTQEDKKQVLNYYSSPLNKYSVSSSYQSKEIISKSRLNGQFNEQSKPNNFNQGQFQRSKVKFNVQPNEDDQIFFKPVKLSKYGLNTINQVTASKQTVRESYKPQNQNDENSFFDSNQNKLKIDGVNSIFYGQQSQKQKQYMRNLARSKAQEQEQSKGTFYKQFSDSKILKLLKQPHKTKVQILKNRFKGQHRLNILKN